MEKLKLRQKPEKVIQLKIKKALELRGWVVREMHASENLSGFPDLYATHKVYGYRWIEVKLPMMKGSKFTPAQLEWFPKMIANGTYIWILTSEADIGLLHKAQNCPQYLLTHGLE